MAVQQIKTMGGSWSAAELPHRVSQKFVEATLRRHAQACPSVDLRYSWTLAAFSDPGAAVEAAVRPLDGGPAVDVVARYLVGADGARSFVRLQLGIEWSGTTGVQREFMGGKMFAVYLHSPEPGSTSTPSDEGWRHAASPLVKQDHSRDRQDDVPT